MIAQGIKIAANTTALAGTVAALGIHSPVIAQNA